MNEWCVGQRNAVDGLERVDTISNDIQVLVMDFILSLSLVVAGIYLIGVNDDDLSLLKKCCCCALFCCR